MEFLVELLELIIEKKTGRRTAAAVYHRDYEKTKNRPYRKYDQQKRSKRRSTEESK